MSIRSVGGKSRDQSMNNNSDDGANPINNEYEIKKKHFGAFTPAKGLLKSLCEKPFILEDSVTRMYCLRCGNVYELSQYVLDNIFGIINLTKDFPLDLGGLSIGKILPNDFDPAKHYILAIGCTTCTNRPIFLIQEPIDDV